MYVTVPQDWTTSGLTLNLCIIRGIITIKFEVVIESVNTLNIRTVY
jgi:hypothetical protein